MKKFLSLSLVLIMTISLFNGVTVSAASVIASGRCGANVTWALVEDGVLVIMGSGNMYDFASHGSPWNRYGDTIKSVDIRGGRVKSIGDDAFRDCSLLTSIKIPDSVTSIGDYAFSDCRSLASIEIPDSVTSIGRYAFYNCRSLTSIGIPDSVISIGDGVFRDCSLLTSIGIPDSVTSIGDEVFRDCSSLASIEIPNSVTSIGHLTFYNCSLLTSIEIPDSVTSIGHYAFYNCSSLTSIEIPDGVTSIDWHTFRECRSLTSIKIPVSVTNICSIAFYGCSSLKNVYYDGTNEQWNAITIGLDNDPIENATVHFAEMEEPSIAVLGNIKAFGGDVMVELLSDGEVVDTKTVTTAYAFENVEEGTYTVRVSAPKHTAREYEITVGSEEVTQDVEIWLYGDVTKDGVVNNNDAIQINRKNNNMTSVFSQTADADYREKVANVTAITGTDTVVNNADVMQINRKINNMSSVFDRIA